MEKIVFAKEMKSIDNYTINKIGIPSLVLMERAAYSVFMHIKTNFDDWKNNKVLLLCGMGNNGADGVALARMLHIEGGMVDIILIGAEEKASPEMQTQLSIARRLGIKIFNYDELKLDEKEDYGNSYSLIVDAVFGIGLSRNIEGSYKEAIERANNTDAVKYAIDIPSGLCADTGSLLGTAFKADYTITFGAIKTGMLLYRGREYCGKVEKALIGFPEEAFLDNEYKTECFHVNSDILDSIPKRKQYSNKGSFGRALIVAGNEEIYGAAYLCARAAYKSGAGLVKILTHIANKNSIQERLPEALLSCYRGAEDGSCLKEEELALVREAVKWSTIICIGPGLGAHCLSEELLGIVLKEAKKENKTLIIDADGLNILSKANKNLDLSFFKDYKGDVIITPHLMEMSRLTKMSVDEIKNDLVKASTDFVNCNNIYCILKDASTVIAFKKDMVTKIGIVTSGSPAMAKGGSGDVLAGILTGLIAINTPVEKAVYAAPYIHGLAGSISSQKIGENSVFARDIIDEIQEITD